MLLRRVLLSAALGHSDVVLSAADDGAAAPVLAVTGLQNTCECLRVRALCYVSSVLRGHVCISPLLLVYVCSVLQSGACHICAGAGEFAACDERGGRADVYAVAQ